MAPWRREQVEDTLEGVGAGVISDLEKMNFEASEALQGVQTMAEGFLQRLPYIIVALLVFFIFYFTAKGIRRLVSRIGRKRRRHANVGLVLGRLAQAGVVFLGLMIALVIALPTFKPAQLVQFLGISSVAIGLAFKDILQNFLAGILLLWNEPFRIGDQIRMGDIEGNVEDIETRATTIRTYDGRRVVVPNSDLFIHPVTVNTAYEERRQEYDFGIGYGDDVEQARKLMLEAMRGIEDVLPEPPPDVLLYDLAASTVVLRARWWIAPPRRSDAMVSRDKVLTAVKKTLTENGIDLPFPTQQVLFHDQTEETDGDRRRQREGWPSGQGDVPEGRGIAASLAESLRKRQGEESGADGKKSSFELREARQTGPAGATG